MEDRVLIGRIIDGCGFRGVKGEVIEGLFSKDV